MSNFNNLQENEAIATSDVKRCDADFATITLGSTDGLNEALVALEDAIQTSVATADWGDISGKPTTLAGYGITDAVDGSGTANKLPKWSDANTLTDSKFTDDGTTQAVNSTVSAAVQLKGETSLAIGLLFNNNHVGSSNTSAITGNSQGVNTGADNTGVKGNASGNPTKNIGTLGYASGLSANNVGIQGYATGGTANYAAQLQDGTEGVGKFLKCITSEGYANWGQAVTGTGTANTVAKFNSTGNITDSIINDNGTQAWISTYQGSTVRFAVSSATHVDTILGVNTLNGGIGLDSLSTGAGSSANYAIRGIAEDSTTYNVGAYGYAGTTTVGSNVGLYGRAALGASNYAIRLQDGTEEVGRILKCVTANGEGNWTRFPYERTITVGDKTTAITTGTAKATFRLTRAMVITDVRASLATAQASGSIFTVDIKQGGTSILSTKITIDNTEKTSVTAATPAVISNTGLIADDTEFIINVDQVGNGTAAGLEVYLIGYIVP